MFVVVPSGLLLLLELLVPHLSLVVRLDEEQSREQLHDLPGAPTGQDEHRDRWHQHGQRQVGDEVDRDVRGQDRAVAVVVVVEERSVGQRRVIIDRQQTIVRGDRTIQLQITRGDERIAQTRIEAIVLADGIRRHEDPIETRLIFHHDDHDRHHDVVEVQHRGLQDHLRVGRELGQIGNDLREDDRAPDHIDSRQGQLDEDLLGEGSVRGEQEVDKGRLHHDHYRRIEQQRHQRDPQGESLEERDCRGDLLA